MLLPFSISSPGVPLQEPGRDVSFRFGCVVLMVLLSTGQRKRGLWKLNFFLMELPGAKGRFAVALICQQRGHITLWIDNPQMLSYYKVILTLSLNSEVLHSVAAGFDI